jgi:Glycosyl hydrolases family 31
MPPQALAALATLLSFTPHGNRVDLELDRGAAEITWVSPSAFRFRRTLMGLLPSVRTEQTESVDLRIEEDAGAVRIRSRLLEVTLRKRGALVKVQQLGGAVLMADLTEPSAAPGGVAWEREARSGVRFYGLGPRTDAGFDLRGQSVRAEIPFLTSTANYGEYHAASGVFQFDFTPLDRYRIEGPSIDYYFVFGLTPKQIFEQANSFRGPAPAWKADPDSGGTWSALQAALLRLVHAAMSGLNLPGRSEPSFSLARYANADLELRERARHLGSLVPGVAAGSIGPSDFRAALGPFLEAYAIEARDRGLPLWHPLPFQFPADPECARHADEFLLGDEMLVAPIYRPGNRREVYLPPGIWTNLETNAVTDGRRTVAVETKSLPVFARSGAIVPLESRGEMVLHYFPKLGAEFFLLDQEVQEWTEVHAAPAADGMRLEIEARAPKAYQWVVHHVERPATVGFEERRYSASRSLDGLAPGGWYWDADRKNLHIRLDAQAREDAIVNVAW